MLRFVRSLAMILTTGSLLSLAPLSANAVISTFDSDLEGWTAVGLDVSYTTVLYPPFVVLTDIALTDNGADMVHSTVGGNPGGYAYSAATLNAVALDNARIISVPYQFRAIYTDPDETAQSNGLAARSRFLADVLTYFSVPLNPGDVSGVPGADAFAVSSSPNPFNPAVTIRYTLPRADRTTLKIYDVRGALVRTLLDDVLTAGPGTATWRGEDDRGARVASGLYFYELRQGGDVRVGKMTLVK